jgi:hypothetical protein
MAKAEITPMNSVLIAGGGGVDSNYRQVKSDLDL